MAKLLLAALLLAATACIGAHAKFSRHSFPKDFVFGTGSAAYQYEGAYKEGGKGPSIWDKFTHIPGKILNNDTGDVADDMYHRYKEDVQLLKDMNLDAFRFSIAWTRILPNGSLSGGINKEGVAFYNNLINEVIAKGLKPFVTIFHWDTPLALEDKYGGFLSENIIKDYVDFAEVCFKEFGDRVKYWSTFNEPSMYSAHGYAVGTSAPGRCSSYVNKNCFPGDSAREPYDGDIRANTSGFRDGVPIGKPEFVPIFFEYAQGLRELLLYTKRRYNDPVLYVMENGIAEENRRRIPLKEALEDGHRIKFHSQHLQFTNHAIRNGVKVKGYFTWTFMDCFEWGDGYLDRFGLIFIDRLNGLKRYRKQSSYWIQDFLKR